MSSTAQTAREDLDGVTYTLPGARLPLHWIGLVMAASLALGLVLSFVEGDLSLALAGSGILGGTLATIGGLGVVRAMNTRITVRVEPRGTLSYHWMADDALRLPMHRVRGAAAVGSEVQVTCVDARHRWRFRTVEDATFIASRITLACTSIDSEPAHADEMRSSLASVAVKTEA